VYRFSGKKEPREEDSIKIKNPMPHKLMKLGTCYMNYKDNKKIKK
jgi:hypothetical protein